MNFLMALAVVGAIAVTPTSGPAPFEPSIIITVTGTFDGSACAYIDALDTPEHDEMEFCLPVSVNNDTAAVQLELISSIPGDYTITGHLHSITGEIIELNTVAVTIQKAN